MRRLMQREAQLHFETYEEVKQIISTYCQQQGIQLVLRFNSDQVDSISNSQAIMQMVNGNVVYHRNQKDITPAIIQRIVQASGQANRASNTQR